MSIGFVAVHYPGPAYFEEFIGRAMQAVRAMRPTPGCQSADYWVTAEGEAVVTTGQWDSVEALQESFAAAGAAGVDFAHDERECRPRQVLHLRPPTERS
jgi:quinol monooxygenase YgiN